MGHYVYYSFEEGGGRGYIGVRHKDPGGDEGYLGSFYDPTFKPSGKIIIREYDTAEGAIRGEIALHALFNVGAASHFANRAKQTHKGFSTAGGTCWKNELTQEQTICFDKPGGEGWERGRLQYKLKPRNPPKLKQPKQDPRRKKILAIKPGGEEVFFKGRNQAARELGIDPHTLLDYLNKGGVLSEFTKYPGWLFRYV